MVWLRDRVSDTITEFSWWRVVAVIIPITDWRLVVPLIIHHVERVSQSAVKMASMWLIVCLALVCLSQTVAFLPVRAMRQMKSAPGSRASAFVLREKNNALVPVESETIESAAAVTGGVLGLIFFGPVGALALAAITKFVAKKDNEGGEAVRGVGKTVVELVNYVTKLDNKFDFTGKVSGAVAEAVDSSDSEVVVNVKTAVDKIKDANKEFGLLDKAGTIVKASGDLSDAALGKLDDLNAKYDFVEQAKKAAALAAEKARQLKEENSL